MVDEYVMTAQKLCICKHRSRDLTPSQQWLYNRACLPTCTQSGLWPPRSPVLSPPDFFCRAI
jgi:hypothetical protein